MKKGEIWLVEFPSSDGHEQSGARPVVVLAETEVGICTVLPMTSNLQALRFPYTIEIKPSKTNGLAAISIALVFQTRAIDSKRIKKKIGSLEEGYVKKINNSLKKLLDV